MVFLYGFYYAQELAIFTIIIVFASFVPLISLSGFLFFGLRHLIDAYNLLTVNRKEIDSSRQMFQKILLTSQLAILLLQGCLISYFWVNNYLACAGLLCIVGFISVVAMCLFNKPIVNYNQEVDQASTNEMLELQAKAKRDS
jgi:hypothetical protein